MENQKKNRVSVPLYLGEDLGLDQPTTKKVDGRNTMKGSLARSRLEIEIEAQDEGFDVIDDTASEAVQNFITEKNAQQRYGRQIQFENYMCSHFMRLLALLVGIFCIPMQLFFEGFVKKIEELYIIMPLQEFLKANNCNEGFCNGLISLTMYLFNTRITCLWMILLSLCTDSLLGFKSSLLTCFGIAIISVFNTFYKDGRPFWEYEEIDSFGHCVFSFGSPDINMFILTFFNGYNLLMYRFKFSVKSKSVLNYSLVFLYVVGMMMQYFAGLANGTNYIYQCFFGQMFGFSYLVFVLTFDREIHRLSEKSGFILQTSRGKKFEVFFLCLAFFSCETIYYLTSVFRWNMPKQWMVNTTYFESQCTEKFESTANYRLGLNQSYNDTACLFFIVGMVFGQSFSVQYVKPLLWVHTCWWKKLIRTLLGGLIATSFYLAFWFCVRSSTIQSTRYFFAFAAPALFISFFMFGVFPIICKYMSLVSDKAPGFAMQQSLRYQARNEMHSNLLDVASQDDNTKSHLTGSFQSKDNN